jgi:serine/threonine protein kinase
VRLAIHKETGEKRAVKIINKENAGPKGVKMVENEVEIMLACNHRNIVRSYLPVMRMHALTFQQIV